MSGVVDLEATFDRPGERSQVFGVGADDEVSAAERSFCHTPVDDVSEGGLCEERTHLPGMVIVERLNGAAHQEAGEPCLTATAPPRLGHHRRGCSLSPHRDVMTVAQG